MSAGGGGSVTPEPSDGPTSSACLEELLARGVAAVRQAAAFALDPGEELRIEAKAHRNDLVTQVDRGVEERIAGHLEATGVPIHGEEAHRVEDFETYRGRAWVLDPIDGTLNYVATHRDWAISLALVDDGAPAVAVLADPVAGRLAPRGHPDRPRRGAGAPARRRGLRLAGAGRAPAFARSCLMPRDRGFEGATARPTLRPRGRAAG